jgi:hypothetical protein
MAPIGLKSPHPSGSGSSMINGIKHWQVNYGTG